MTKNQIKDLDKRMHNHSVVNDTAVVVITAKELQSLLDAHEALETALVELENIASYSGSSGNWPLQDAVSKARQALK